MDLQLDVGHDLYDIDSPLGSVPELKLFVIIDPGHRFASHPKWAKVFHGFIHGVEDSFVVNVVSLAEDFSNIALNLIRRAF